MDRELDPRAWRRSLRTLGADTSTSIRAKVEVIAVLVKKRQLRSFRVATARGTDAVFDWCGLEIQDTVPGS
jgi:hypothetical protein